MSADRQTSATLHWLTVGLVLLSSATLLVVESDGEWSWWAGGGLVLFQVALVIGASFYLKSLGKRLGDSPAVTPVLVLLALFTLGHEMFARTFLGTGRPLELVLMCGLKNVMLGLAACAMWVRYQRIAVALGLLQLFFAASLTDAREVHLLMVVYGLGGIIWLSITYWEGLRARLLTQRRSPPRVQWIAVGTLGALLLVALTVGENRATRLLWGFMPSSGGSGSYDPYARSGVGDGDALVAGMEDIKSFAPIEEAPMLADDKPSLYDMFDETYDEPVKIEKTERAISLPPKFAKEVERRMAQTKQAGREFSLLRKTHEANDRHVGDRDSMALLHVAGRVPLHLRLQTYDLFDGIDWHPEPPPESPQELRLVADATDRNWLRLPPCCNAYEAVGSTETHALKIINLETSSVPSPLLLEGIHFDRLDDATMFAWAQPSVICMDREVLPPLSVFHLASHAEDRSALPTGIGRHSYDAYRAVPKTFFARSLRDLANTWVLGIPHGLEQIERIEQKLRTEYVHDRTARSPEGCVFPVGEFLFRSRRGEDYQFASAAAILLRSLGYSTRLVSGFYADPEKYDPRSRHTSIHADDLHFWVEVHIGENTWITVEPTPGYERLEPPLSLAEQAFAVLAGIGSWMWRSRVLVLLICGAGTLVYLTRNTWSDACRTLWWKYAASKKRSRARVLAALAVIERRMAAAKLGRPASQTTDRWLRQFCDSEGEQSPVREFLELIDWAAFAPSHATYGKADHIEQVCARMLETWTITRFRRISGTTIPQRLEAAMQRLRNIAAGATLTRRVRAVS